ncbi:MAG TPA: Arc family DNA-binding protein [Firmicutes bacterium]|nr:Arc family DNA-binding protein [Candidatus Fermentithermobacillaceae bacterium]
MTGPRDDKTDRDRKPDKEKKQVLLRLSPTLWRELAAWAEDEFRSINGQIEYLLTEAVRMRRKARLGGQGEPMESQDE